MEARPATRSDLAKVFRKLADRMAAEYRTAGHSVSSAKDMLRGQIDEGNADCLMDNGHTLAVLTWFPERSNAYTSFAAVEEFFAPRYVRPLRTHMRERQAALGGIMMVSYSFSDHPSTARWFSALGFQGPFEQPDCPTVFKLFRP